MLEGSPTYLYLVIGNRVSKVEEAQERREEKEDNFVNFQRKKKLSQQAKDSQSLRAAPLP
jgi:hypothetical protein